MNTDLFGKLKFDNGWYGKTKVKIFNKEYEVSVKLSSYYEEDGITNEQVLAVEKYKNNQDLILHNIEKSVDEYANCISEKCFNFIPSVLVFERNGDYGLVFDNTQDIENGIIVLCTSNYKVMLLEEYL